jgi:hypothetical protein
LSIERASDVRSSVTCELRHVHSHSVVNSKRVLTQRLRCIMINQAGSADEGDAVSEAGSTSTTRSGKRIADTAAAKTATTAKPPTATAARGASQQSKAATAAAAAAAASSDDNDSEDELAALAQRRRATVGLM